MAIFVNFWQHLAAFGNFCLLLATFGTFWQLLASVVSPNKTKNNNDTDKPKRPEKRTFVNDLNESKLTSRTKNIEYVFGHLLETCAFESTN